MAQHERDSRPIPMRYNARHEEGYQRLVKNNGKATEIDEAALGLQEYWRKFLTQPDWYITLDPFLKKWMLTDTQEAQKYPETEQMRTPFVTLVGNMLEQSQIPLGETGPDFDEPRRKRMESGLPAIDQLIVHHSETTPELTQGEYDPEAEARNLNALGLIRQYAWIIYMDPDNPWHGKPVYSGHYSPSGDQVFYAYNALVTPDGQVKQLVTDERFRLLHAGPQPNTNSAGLVLIGTYDTTNPPPSQIEGLTQSIITGYERISTENIIGHEEVKPDKPCPGKNFLGENGWKKDLHERVRQLRGEIFPHN